MIVRKLYLKVLLVVLALPLNILGQEFSAVTDFSNLTKTQYANGIAVADYDNDGDLDIYIVAISSYKADDPSTWNRLFENQGGTFKDVTIVSGLDKDQLSSNDSADNGTKMGASWGDYDSDGYPDLFLTNLGKNQLWHNKGDGTFENVSVQAGIEGSEGNHSSSAVWWDYDNDGDLDLYVSNWLGNNNFFRNEGNNQFTDISEITGLSNVGTTWVSIPFDVNKDGLLDLYVINDFNANRLFINQSNDQFIEQTGSYNLGDLGNGMGVDICDYGNDGNFDIYITNISQVRENPFFVNNGNSFDNLAIALGIHDGKWGWGTRFFDMDHDTDEDLFLVNQRFFDSEFEEHNQFYKLQDDGTFNEVSEDFGLNKFTDARTTEVFDYDNDGDLDIILGSWGDFPILYNNRVSGKGNWLQVELQGTVSNRNAYGTVVKIKTSDGTTQHRLNHGVNFLGQSIKPLHFGLSDNNKIDELSIFWPSGRIEKITDLQVNQSYSFVEGNQNESPEETYGTVPDAVDIIDEELSQKSIARTWNELLLESIRKDFARPTVHARNLFHISMAMYDAWAVYDSEANPVFLGNTLGNYKCEFNGVPIPEDVEAARKEAISYACYRLLSHRFRNSPGAGIMLPAYTQRMKEALGFDINYTSTDYTSGVPAALGNYIAEQIIQFGLQDGSNEENDYANIYYQPVNTPLVVDDAGNTVLTNPNNWQPLTLSTFIDQSGNEIPGSTPDFLSPEWGQVVPFSLTEADADVHHRDGFNYYVYHDPGKPVEIITDGTDGIEDPYKWGFAMVSVWSAHLDPADGKMIDISPASLGNTEISSFPKTFEQYKSYYKFFEGGDLGLGHDLNPVTGQPYTPQWVPRGDYARVLAEFWADGPDSETPPGHWYTILNYVNDHPLTEKKFTGKGESLDDLEWDVKSYLTLGGAMHDVAISAWGIKGYYDYIRPISAIRYMAHKGQSTDNTLDNYHPEGIPLISGYIEVVQPGDPLAGAGNEHVGDIKLYAWKGTHFVEDPDSDVAGVDWILAENWVPYQRPSFVTPPFAGYVSGHSTFSRAAAEVLTRLTGSKFFPGGMGVFNTKKNAFLVFEDGPSQDLTLQWATYQDASDQTSLSRIWGGIHPPIDDIPGRFIGEQIGITAFETALKYFYQDNDNDGVYSFLDCDDSNPAVYETCEGQAEGVEYTIYPVPVDQEMTLKIAYKGALNIKVYNVYGNLVRDMNRPVENNTCLVPIDNLSPGAYIVVFSNANNEKLIAKKIVKS